MANAARATTHCGFGKLLEQLLIPTYWTCASRCSIVPRSVSPLRTLIDTSIKAVFRDAKLESDGFDVVIAAAVLHHRRGDALTLLQGDEYCDDIVAHIDRD